MSSKEHRGNLILGTVGKEKQQCAHKKGGENIRLSPYINSCY